MNDILEQALLYDFYGELLTSHQKEIYEQIVLEDLSLSEIAAEAGIKCCKCLFRHFHYTTHGIEVSFFYAKSRTCSFIVNKFFMMEEQVLTPILLDLC